MHTEGCFRNQIFCGVDLKISGCSDLVVVLARAERSFETGVNQQETRIIENIRVAMDRLKQIVEKESESTKKRIFAKVDEEIESFKRNVLTEIESYMKDENQTSIATNMKLEFRNRIARTILTSEDIKGEGGVPIEVALVDDMAGDVVDDEPEASVNVEIVLLKAKPDGSDWTAQEFEENIVSEKEAKQPILAGNVALQLQRGVGVVENIKIRNHACIIKPPQFMLGARVVGASRIKEAMTEPFILKNYRVRYYKKHKNPSLSDEVSRLVHIRRGGNIEKRLQHKEIYRVEDFLIQLLINPEGLKSIVTPQVKKWKAIVNNAQACQSGERTYCYAELKQNRGVVFSILGHAIGLCSGSRFSQTLSEKEEADAEKLLASAYRNWGEVKAFDDQNSLQQHLASLSPSEMMGESSSICSYVPFHSADSTTNLLGQDSGAFTVAGSDDSLFDGVDELFHNILSCSRQHEGLENESNADEGRKRWRKLFCVLTFRKRVSLDVSPNQKKQKIGYTLDMQS